MKITSLTLGALALASSASATIELPKSVSDSIRKLAASYGTSVGSTCACGVLQKTYNDKVYLPGTAEYTDESSHYWDARATLAPKCVFTPSTVIEVAGGVLALNLCKSQFAIRSGGHMPVS